MSRFHECVALGCERSRYVRVFTRFLREDIADLWWVRALYVWLVVRTDGLEFEERTRRCRVGGPLSSGGPEGDGEGLYLVTYWPNKQ